MDGRDHKMTPTSTGHEGHAVHLCHRCGWPFPNPHPSAKHRRAHRKVCGTIEGYKIIHSEEHDHHLDDEHGSDDNEHTPSPKLVKKNVVEFGSSGGIGEKSNKSEDDVFSDAVTDFSDSGISPRLEERFESVRGLDKSMEQKNVEGDLYGGESVKLDETADRTEILNDPTSNEKTSKSEILKDVAIDNVNEYSDGGILQGEMKTRQEADIQQEERNKLASVILDSEQANPALERKEELCDKSVKLDQPPQNDESFQNFDDIAEVESASRSAKMDSSIGTVGEIALAEETHEYIDASEGVKKVSDCTEDFGEVEQKTSLVRAENAGNVDASEGEKCDMDGNEKCSNSSAENTFAPEDDQTIRALKKDVDHCEEKSHNELLEARNEKGEGASEEVQVMLDSTMSLDKSNDFPSSCEANSDSRNLEELSKPGSSSLESTDNGFEKSFQGLNIGKVTEVPEPGGSAGLDAELNHETDDVLDKSSPPTATLEDPKPSVIPEMTSEIHVTSNVVRVESVESERTPEQPVSELLGKNSADDNSCIGEGVKASESIDAAEVNENSESPTPKVQDAQCFCNSEEPLPSPLDDKNIIHVEQKGDVSAIDLPVSISRSDSLEGNCGSVSVSSQSNTAVAETNSHSPDTLETNSQTEECHLKKSDAFEPPSFMTLVQSGGEGDQVTSEIETVQNNQRPKSADGIEAGWFPSLTNVVNESEGRKKNEEVIAKVTNWSPVKQQQHSPLKNLLNDVKSTNTNQKDETDELKDNSSVMVGGPKNHDNNTNKDMDEWNSPARYPIEITKEKKKKKKKKGKSYWVPFVCCSSVHRDL